ncbi:hypothetical protein L596_030404 [Steinernema carpocapsae]|uniref:Uncharacterized protein n=1 Tax=Steinernema carpocapsae TaxID=34508 RepID=A0A4U5LPC3_STECR|nr:hypothetical protein L596_030404 [Steinernema carpocapsae]
MVRIGGDDSTPFGRSMVMPKKSILKHPGNNSIASADEDPRESFSRSVNPGPKRHAGPAPGFSQSHRRPRPDMERRGMHNFGQSMQQFPPQNFGQGMQQFPPQMAPNWGWNPLMQPSFGGSFQQPCQHQCYHSIPRADDYPYEDFSRSMNPGHKRHISGRPPGCIRNRRQMPNFGQSMQQLPPQNFGQSFQGPPPNFGQSMQQYPLQMAPNWGWNPMGPFPQHPIQPTSFGSSFQQSYPHKCYHSMESSDDYPDEVFTRHEPPPNREASDEKKFLSEVNNVSVQRFFQPAYQPPAQKIQETPSKGGFKAPIPDLPTSSTQKTKNSTDSLDD